MVANEAAVSLVLVVYVALGVLVMVIFMVPLLAEAPVVQVDTPILMAPIVLLNSGSLRCSRGLGVPSGWGDPRGHGDPGRPWQF